MEVFIGILFWVALIVIIVVFVKKNNARKLKKAEEELKNETHVILIDEALREKGYVLSYYHSFSWGDKRYSITVGVDKNNERVGEMNFYTHKLSSYYLNYYLHHCKEDKYYGINNHMIFLNDAGIIIKSEDHFSKPIPEWLEICGKIIRDEGFTINYPQWVEECINDEVGGDPRKYVNTVFNE